MTATDQAIDAAQAAARRRLAVLRGQAYRRPWDGRGIPARPELMSALLEPGRPTSVMLSYDRGTHASGWWRNSEYDSCYHLSLTHLTAEVDGDLFPCFVGDTLDIGLPNGLRYRTVGPSQIQFGGTVIYMTGPTFPDDLEPPTNGALIATLPAAAVPVDGGTVALGECININDGTQTLVGLAPASAETDAPGEIIVNGWAVDVAIAVAGSIVYDAVGS